MLLKRELDIRGKNAGQVTDELAKLGASALLEWLDHPSPPEPQPASGSTYAPKIEKDEARVDWTQPAALIERQVRAFIPVPGAWFEANGERIKLLEAEALGGSGTPGEILDDGLTVATESGAIRAALVQRAGRGPMSAAELLRGFAISKGTILK
jgi:methionyl-tRNA formyltransferase